MTDPYDYSFKMPHTCPNCGAGMTAKGNLERELIALRARYAEEMQRTDEARKVAREILDAAECFTSSEIVDETSGTIPLMDRLRRCLESVRSVIVKGRCTCHERDSSYLCDYCHSQGYFGHMEQSLKKESGGVE